MDSVGGVGYAYLELASVMASGLVFSKGVSTGNYGSIAYVNSSDSITFNTGSNSNAIEYMRLNSSGLGIGTTNPNRKLDVSGSYEFVHNPTSELTSSGAYGDIVTFGSGTGFTTGGLYYYGTSGTWAAADADSESTSKYLLAIALGTTPSSGMLLRGYAKYTGTSYTSMTNGGIQFISTTAGSFTETAPTNTGQIVRIIGYCIDATNDILYFNPSNDWIQL